MWQSWPLMPFHVATRLITKSDIEINIVHNAVLTLDADRDAVFL